MSVLTVSELCMAFGDRTLFSKANFSVEKHEKVGLIGNNGVGKTTLFNLITGSLTPESGICKVCEHTTVGVLSQFACKDSDKTVYEETLSVFEPLMKMEKELEEVNKKLLSAHTPELIERQQYLQEKLIDNGSLTYEARTVSALTGLGFSKDDIKLVVSTQSGGQRAKIGLAKLLLSKPDLLLLDEPTNHLDIKSTEWLEEFIISFGGACIIISHDRYFLDRVTNKTVEIEAKKVHTFAGNYTRYAEQKELRQKTVRRQYENTMKEVARIEGIIEQQHEFNRERNIRMAESKQKQIDRMVKDLEMPDEAQREIKFLIKPAPVSGEEVLNATRLTAAFDDKVLYENLDLHITRGEKVFILGDNGVGKTTLIKQLLERRGRISYGAGVKVGYFDQLSDTLYDGETVLSTMQNAFPRLTQTEVRSCLAAFLFRGEEVFKSVGTLSGGERARLTLCRMMTLGANLLLLDEPTNHLDVGSRDALEKVLSEYDGTIIAVSHDRYFINKIATRVAHLTKNEMISYDGGYDDYRLAIAKQNENKPKPQKKEMGAGGKSYREQKQKAFDLRRKKGELERTEKAIESAEEEIKRLQAELQSNASNYEKVAELSSLLEENTRKTEELYEKWEALSAELQESAQ